MGIKGQLFFILSFLIKPLSSCLILTTGYSNEGKYLTLGQCVYYNVIWYCWRLVDVTMEGWHFTWVLLVQLWLGPYIRIQDSILSTVVSSEGVFLLFTILENNYECNNYFLDHRLSDKKYPDFLLHCATVVEACRSMQFWGLLYCRWSSCRCKWRS